jgi:DNA-binding MarR family transcriptional regulator
VEIEERGKEEKRKRRKEEKKNGCGEKKIIRWWVGMQLTERDIEVIRFVNEFGFCDVTQLRIRFSLKKTWMYDIMKRLVDAGLVSHKSLLHARHGVYFVTAKGAKLTDLPPIDRVSMGQYEHQITIVKTHIKLWKQYPDANWISERRLKHDKFYDGVGKKGHVPDGILILSDGRQIAIEVEMSVKGKNRIEKILKGYGIQLSIKEVWYYCSPPVISMLTKLAAKMPFIKIYPLEEFLSC